MSSIKTIVDEIETVSLAHSAIETFIYDRISHLNTTGTKVYPLILLEPTPDTLYDGQNQNNLPINEQFNFRIFSLDLWKQSERATVSLRQKQTNVELYLRQIIAELKRRSQISTTTLVINKWDELTGLHSGYDMHNDKLVQFSMNISIGIKSACVAGTFSY